MLALSSIVLWVYLGVSSGLKNVEDVEFVGRFIMGDTTQKSDWSGSALKMNLLSELESVDVNLEFVNCVGKCKYYVSVEENCKVVGKHKISENSTSIHFKLPSSVGQVHELMFTKVTEVACSDATGTMEIGDFTVVGASFVKKSDLQKSCNKKDYKMLVFGDSVSVTYGIDGTSPCTFTAETENVNHGYAASVASAINAELHMIGWSGKGVVRNYGDKSQMSREPLPVLANRTIGSKPYNMDMGDGVANYWNPVNYQADLIIILLGSNDYSTEPNPSDEQFTTGLINFINTIKKDYPKAVIGAMCSPSAHGPQCANIESATVQTNTHYLFLSPSLYAPGYGCDAHPNVESQANMAQVVTPFAKGLLGI